MPRLIESIQEQEKGIPVAVALQKYWPDNELINPELAAQALEVAEKSPRNRIILKVHEDNDIVRLMVNAMTSHTYARPHFHSFEKQREILRVLKGSARVVFFTETGEISSVVKISDGPDDRKILIIKPGQIHTFIPGEEGFVMLERTRAPDSGYDPKTDKTFMDWAPAEPKAGEDGFDKKMIKAREYMDKLRERIDA
jgi:cupin fold WbuC family metalloprotein